MAQKVSSPESSDEATPNTKDNVLGALPKIINDQGEEEKLTLDGYKNAYGTYSMSNTGMNGIQTQTVNEGEVIDKARAYAEEKSGEKWNWNGRNSENYRKFYEEGQKIYSKEYGVKLQQIQAIRNKAREFDLDIDAYGGSSENKEKKTLDALEKAVKKGKITQAQLEEIKRAGEKAAQDTEANPYAGMSQITFKDNSGRKYNVEVSNGRFGEVTYQGQDEGKKSFRGCEVLPAKLYKQRDCFFCPLFAVVYRAADTMATLSMQKLASSFAVLIALGLGIWIAFQTLTHVSSITKQDAPKFLGGLIKQSFKFLIAFLLLQYSGEIYHWVVNPLLQAGLQFGNSMLFESHLYQDIGKNETTQIVMKTVFFGEPLYKKLEDFITNVQREIAFMQSIGSTLMCIGGNLMMGAAGMTMDNFGSGFQMMIQGLVLCIFGFLLSLAFAFYLIDAVVQLGIVGALMPFLIACWPFKLTAQYTNKGFSMLLNSFFVFVFVGLVVSINLQLIDAALVTTSTTDQVSETLTTSGQGQNPTQIEKIRTGALGGIYEAINAQDENKLKELTDISGVGFLILLFCCIFGFKFCGQSSALADKMAGGGMKAMAPGIATMGASATLSAGKKASQPIREAVADKVTEVGGNAMRKAGAFLTGRGRKHGQKEEGGGDKGADNEAPASENSGGGSTGGAGKGTSAGAQNNKKVLGQANSQTNKNQTPDNNPGKAGGNANNGKPGGTSQNNSGVQAENGTAAAADTHSAPTHNLTRGKTESERQRGRQAYLEKTQNTPPRAKGRHRGHGGSKGGNRKVSNRSKKRR